MTRTNQHNKSEDDGLTDQQRRFVYEYVKDLNKSQAAIRAGYSKESAGGIGWQLMEVPAIQTAVDKLLDIDLSKQKTLGKRALKEWMSLAFSNAQDFADIVVPQQLKEMPRELTAAVQEVRTTTRKDHRSDEIETTVNLRLYNKEKSLENLAKIAGLLIDRVEHSGSIKIEDSPWSIKDPTKE